MSREVLTKPIAKNDPVKQSSVSRVQGIESYIHSSVAGGATLDRGQTFNYDFNRIPVRLRTPLITLQPKLKIGDANDKYEQEAAGVANQVMRMPDQ